MVVHESASVMKAGEIPPTLTLCCRSHLISFDKLDIKITFFIVGQDAAIEKNHPVLLLDRPRKRPWSGKPFFIMNPGWKRIQKKNRRTIIAEEILKANPANEPTCLGGPGSAGAMICSKCWKTRLYLLMHHYCPPIFSPLMRKYYFAKSTFPAEEKKPERIVRFFQRNAHWNHIHGELMSKKKVDGSSVTTIPVFKIPFHQSYLILHKYILNRIDEVVPAVCHDV